MSDSQQFRAKSREMGRLAAGSITEAEKQSYLALAQSWAELATQAEMIERRDVGARGNVIPLRPPSSEPEES